MPLFSVVIPCFNAKAWIRDTLESVYSQELPGIEVIVVDDGSTDDSVVVIREEFKNVCLFQTRNQGPSRARNLGTKIATGEFIQYLDADDLLAPGKLKIQSERLRNSGADIAYGDWQRLKETSGGQYVCGDKVERKMSDPEMELFTNFWCPPAAYLFRRSIVEKVGGWNERLPYIQDARFALDCALHGGSFAYCSGIMAYYRCHSSGSVSTRDPVGFVQDCFRNATEVEEWWRAHGNITEERRKALLNVYGYVARASFANDKLTFESAYRSLEKLQPNYVPEHPKKLAAASRIFGYRQAEALAFWWRKAKDMLAFYA